eukprot:g1107.t1
MEVEGVWVFFILASMCILVVVYHLGTWNKTAKEVIKAPEKGSDETDKTRWQKLIDFKSEFNINGKWFLVTMYASELLESTMQTYNLIFLYTCIFPTGVILSLCLFLCVDHMYRIYVVWQPNTVQRRDTQVLIDLCVDLVCMMFPLFFMWFGFEIPFSIWETSCVVAIPTILAISKLDELMEQNVRRRATMETVERQRKMSLSRQRRRSSLFEKNSVETGVEEQDKTIGNIIKLGLTSCTILFCIFFFISGIVAISISIECDELLWEYCQVKVPFCKFQESCNCAVLTIDSHNMTSLPKSIESMTAMKKLQINHGPLTHLPEHIGALMPSLANLNLDFNRLKSLPVSLRNTANLAILYASFNELSSVPREILEHNGIMNLDLSTNNLTHLPEIRMPQLRYFYVVNNSLTRLPDSIFEHQYLTQIVVNGNQLISIPDSIGNLKATLRTFGASRNNLTSFPSSFQQLEKLSIIDVRNNSLAYLPDSFNKLTALTHLTVFGNPLCSNGWVGTGNVLDLMQEEGCKRQCSVMCLDILLLNDFCDYSCNVPECNYDSGQC